MRYRVRISAQQVVVKSRFRVVLGIQPAWGTPMRVVLSGVVFVGIAWVGASGAWSSAVFGQTQSAVTRPVTTRPAVTKPARAGTATRGAGREIVAISLTTAPAAEPAGERLKLKPVGDVFVPPWLPRSARQVDVVVHFHGAAGTVEREFAAAGLQAVLVTVNYGGLSKAYETPFSDARLFGTLLDRALAGLKERRLVAADAEWRRVCVSSFSAGFGAVRAILKVPGYYERVDAVYLADTLYAGYVDEATDRRVNPDDVRDFCRLAVEAASGRKTLIVTHSYLEPGRYAGTHETADSLIAAAGAVRRTVDEKGPATMRIISRVDRGRFHVWGCAGTTGEDHMAHLRNMRFWYPQLPVERIVQAAR